MQSPKPCPLLASDAVAGENLSTLSTPSKHPGQVVLEPTRSENPDRLWFSRQSEKTTEIHSSLRDGLITPDAYKLSRRGERGEITPGVYHPPTSLRARALDLQPLSRIPRGENTVDPDGRG